MPALLLVLILAATPDPTKLQVAGADIPGLAHDVMAQIKPCYAAPKLPFKAVTTLHVRYNADGSLASVPELIKQTPIPDAYRGEADVLVLAAKRAAVRCAPLHLPAALYRGGWDNMDLSFAIGTGDAK